MFIAQCTNPLLSLNLTHGPPRHQRPCMNTTEAAARQPVNSLGHHPLPIQLHACIAAKNRKIMQRTHHVKVVLLYQVILVCSSVVRAGVTPPALPQARKPQGRQATPTEDVGRWNPVGARRGWACGGMGPGAKTIASSNVLLGLVRRPCNLGPSRSRFLLAFRHHSTANCNKRVARDSVSSASFYFLHGKLPTVA